METLVCPFLVRIRKVRLYLLKSNAWFFRLEIKKNYLNENSQSDIITSGSLASVTSQRGVERALEPTIVTS